MDGTQNVGIRALVEALGKQIYRLCVTTLYSRLPWLLRVHNPVIDRGRYRLRFSPNRFATVLYRHPAMPREDEQFLGRFLKPGMTYVDVGANIGTTTLAGAHAVGPTGTVIAFEPHPRTFQDLSASVALNPELAPRISLVASAVGAAEGRTGISDLQANDANHIDLAGIPVPMTTLDQALDGIAHIDLLKVDVEGYEKDVLMGAGRTLEKTDAIYFESCEDNFAHFGYSADDVFALLEARGFACYSVDPADFSLTAVEPGRRCAHGYENLLACKDARLRPHSGVQRPGDTHQSASIGA